MAESDFRVPVRGGIWSLRTGPDLGEDRLLDFWLSEVGSRIPGSWGCVARGAKDGFYILRATGLLVLAFICVDGGPVSNSLTLPPPVHRRPTGEA